MEDIIENIATKKELGQFFSGSKVAALLARLASSDITQSIIDPMCGIGDLLVACQKQGKEPTSLTGIEIDGQVYKRAMMRFENAAGVQLLHGNAFQKETIGRLSPDGYDLVITNPPYVRYQTFGDSIPAIRENLLWSLKYFHTTDEQDKKLLETLIKGFSGLSDLAVPSWILCSLLVKEGGRLAIVVPATWLSRDYALIIKYLLIRWFQIEYIVEDANSAWFQSAQVKTVLVVARRIPRKTSLLSWHDEFFRNVTLFEESMTGKSLVGKAFDESDSAESDFVHAIDKGVAVPGLYRNEQVLIRHFAEDTRSIASNQKWFGIMEPLHASVQLRSNGIKASSALKAWYNGTNTCFHHLQDIGVAVSQGLRTGANFFFYLDYKTGNNEEEIIVMPSKEFGKAPFRIGDQYTKKVVRKQAELDASFSLQHFKSKGAVLALQEFALPEDILYTENSNKTFAGIYQPISEPLAQYIRIAASQIIQKETKAKQITDLSAVKPNIKVWNEKRPEEAPRFWYMLPEFTKRHFPDLFIPRVNNEYAKTRLNNDASYLIDANFSSLWITDNKSPYDNYSLLALLNSSWSVIAMEEYGTVMGGGALKLEATQLKKIPLPLLEMTSIAKLSTLGQALAKGGPETPALLYQIDTIIVNSFGFDKDTNTKLSELNAIKEYLLKKRSK